MHQTWGPTSWTTLLTENGRRHSWLCQKRVYLVKLFWTKFIDSASYRYRQLPLVFIRDELAFESFEQVCTFLTNHSAAFFLDPNSPDDEKTWLPKPAQEALRESYEEKYRKATIKGAI